MLNLKLTYLGAFQIEVNGQLINNFRTEKTAALLAYLVLEGQSPVLRHQLTDLLWHGYEKKAAQTSLRVALTYLRQMLAPAEPIKATHKHIYFDDTDVVIWSDVGALTETASLQGEQLSAQQLTERLALYRGEFLEGWEQVDSVPFQEWLQQRRVYYQSMAANLGRRLTPLLNKGFRPQLHNLPRRVTPLFGYTAALTQLRALLLNFQHPLITLIGEGGIGKTRLTLAAAWSLLEVTLGGQPSPFPDGLWFVPLNDLVPTADLPDKLAAAIGTACGCSFATTTSVSAQLYAWLRTKSLLLILDSFEHLIAASTWLHSLLQTAPQVKILVTSRQRLNLPVAVVFPVYELATPAAEPSLTMVDHLTLPSVQLFLERGQRVRPGFHLQPGNAADVAQICRQMAGIPLAIELAASLLLLYTPAQIAAQLATASLTLRSEWVDLPARHQSIEAVLAASWHLLSAAEAALLARLAVIKGCFPLAAATTIGVTAPDTFFALVDKSLLRQAAQAECFTMHDLVRHYALRQLQQQPADELATRRRHAVYYLDMVAAEAHALPNVPAAQKQLLAELENVRAAWHWSVDQGEVAIWAKASDGLLCFYRMMGFSQEAVTALHAAATALRAHRAVIVEAAPYQALLARLLVGLVHFMPYAEGELLLREALDWSERSGDADSQSMTYQEMAALARLRGDFSAMLTYAQQAYAWAQRSGQPQRELASLHGLAMAYYFQNDVTSLLAMVDELQVKLKQTPNRELESVLLTNLGHLYTEQGNYGKALSNLRYAFVGNLLLKPSANHEVRLRLARLYYEVGLFDAARILYHHTLAYFEHEHNFYEQVVAHYGLGCLQYTTGNLALAREHLNAAHQLTRQHAMPYFEHIVLLDLGYTLATRDTAQATACFEEAIRLGEPKQWYSTVGRAYLGFAQLALQQNEQVQAAAAVECALTQWYKGHPDRAEPCHFYWHCYTVLQTLGDPRAPAILQQGYTALLQRAETLINPLLRRAFLENVPVNRALAVAVQAGVLAAPAPTIDINAT